MKTVTYFIVSIILGYANAQNSTVNSAIKPEFGEYNSGNNNRHTLGDWLLTGNWGSNTVYIKREHEYEGFDGWYNNLASPALGAVDRPLLRRWPAAYKDGVYQPNDENRPNPLLLSERLLSGESGTKSKTGKSALLVFFGQQVVEELLDAQRPACPPEYFNIPIPQNHSYLKTPGHTELPFLRTRYDQTTGFSPNNPRQQLNEITPYIDGGLTYGTTKQWADQLRTYENGTIDPDGCLASSENGLFPAYNKQRLPMANPPPPFYHKMFINNHELLKVNRFFKLGNPRGNENSFLLTFGVLWFRWHNYLAKRLRHLNPDWSSDKVFNEARKWVIATHQKIVYYDWLESWLGDKSPSYKSYDPSIDPQIDQFFQSAAMRFGHTLVVPGVYLRDYIRNGCKSNYDTWGKNTVRTCNIFWRPYEPMLTKTDDNSNEFIDIDRLLMGMAYQLTEEEDHKIVEDLRGNVFGPLEFPRRDLMALNIQRARDHGLPDYNTARQAFGLLRVGFDHFSHVEPKIIDEMRNLYDNSTDNIDIWVGGILETKDSPGELFKAIIKDQFRRIRDGDRFWFENLNNNLFTIPEIGRIFQITLYDIIMAVTKMDHNDVPQNVFRVPRFGANDSIISRCKLMESSCTDFNKQKFNCYHLPPLTRAVLNENCTEEGSYDYFSNSEASYIVTFTFLAAIIVGLIGVVFLLIRRKDEQLKNLRIKENRHTRETFKLEKKMNYPMFVVHEWLGYKLAQRRVIVLLKNDKKQISVVSQNGELLRLLNFETIYNRKIQTYLIDDEPYLIIRCPHIYDLVLNFETSFIRKNFINEFDQFLNGINMENYYITSFNLKYGLKQVTTMEERQDLLERFYRVCFAQAFKINYDKEYLLSVDDTIEKEIINTELTISEFADALSMRSNDEFVIRMFHLVDKDKSGTISFREFIDLIVIFAKGTAEEKAKLLFDMYDINAVGYLTRENFVAMIKSFLACVEGKLDDSELEKTTNIILQQVGGKDQLTFNDFLKLCGREIGNLSKATINFKGVNKETQSSYLEKARDTIENIYMSRQEILERFQGDLSSHNNQDVSEIIDNNQEITLNKTKRKYTNSSAILNYIEINAKRIFWMILYTLVLIAIFAERAYYYSVEREHSGLRRIAGYGVTVTRGAASAMMFTYSSLLVTMCKNTITLLRDTVANNYFPFDDSVEFHKYIAVWAFVFTIVHIVGHAFNFYHISTQTADDLTCLFRNFFHATHELPKFHYWCWSTITGFTGIILTIIWALIYIFAHNIVRRKIYNWFWYTHNLYPLFFIFMILHGCGRLIQAPFFYYFCSGPLILFTIDYLISICRKKIEIPVLRAEILPSNVTMLEIKKPENFHYKSGQWIRIACVALNRSEYHPFTLSSSPDEKNLTLHIRAIGPWTMNLRKIYDGHVKATTLLPAVYLDGPFGEGHQDWNLYEISILIGAGIGVTPFASILKDVAFKSQQSRCKKVYFIWVSRNQKQFEWLIDIIRELELKDKKNLVSCHIFITQFFEKFDLRTIFLYICERHYQRVSQRSLFTHLKAVTHFGRPNFPQFFQTVSDLHNASTVGVFSCGPPSITASVDQACNRINITREQKFIHHYKNF